MTTTTTHLALVPRDGFFAKDGRGWHTSASGRGHGLDWPWPSTVLGALRSLWGRGEETRSNTIFTPDDWRKRTQPIQLGRTLVLRREHGTAWRVEDATWPVPLDALWLEGRNEVHRLDPVKPIAPTLGRDDDEAREALWCPVPDDAQKPLASPRWWNSEEFNSWLAGKSVSVRKEALATTRRVQVHVGISPEELTSDDGVLFSHDVIETLDRSGEWALGVEVDLPAGGLPNVATLGSDSRLARVESLPATLFEPPASVLVAFRAFSTRFRLVAVSPLCFEKGWLPDGLANTNGEYRGKVAGIEVILRAAFVPRPVHVSGWDMAKGEPKPTSRMVPPGSVYFFERADGKPFGEAEARGLWLAALGTRADEGFGRVVPGVWRPWLPDQRGSQMPIADPLLEGEDGPDELARRDTRVAAVERRGETSPALATNPDERGSEHGFRGRAGESRDAGSGTRAPADATRHIQTALGSLSYAELAPHLARRTQAVEEAIEAGELDDRAIDERLIEELHRRICAELTPQIAGWRRSDVTVGTHTPPTFAQVQTLVRDYTRDLEARLRSLPSSSDSLILECLAFAEGRLLSIHPFADFNGRLTRVFLRLLLRRIDLPAVDLVPRRDETPAYLEALRAADRHDWRPLAEIWKARLEQEESR